MVSEDWDLLLLQISDNPELFQPVQEELIMQANSGQFINDKLWGQAVRSRLLMSCYASTQ